MHLRIVTINVWNEEGDSRRCEVINRELRRLDPDLVAFQEVVYTPERNQLDELLKGLNLHSTHQVQVMAGAPPMADRYGGNAVATPWPHRIVEAVDLRQSDAPDVPWCTLAAAISVPDEGEVLFVAP